MKYDEAKLALYSFYFNSHPQSAYMDNLKRGQWLTLTIIFNKFSVLHDTRHAHILNHVGFPDKCH